MGFVLPPQQGVVQLERHAASGKFEWHFPVFPQQFAVLRVQVRNGERDEMLNRTLIGGKAGLRHGSIGAAVGIVNDVDNRMIEEQRMQSHTGAQE